MVIAANIQEKQQADGANLFDAAASVFVTANAGSGKTSQLTRRVLGLLLCGVKPAKILCLTFTNAAAAEMKQRVQSELGAWVMVEDTTLHAKLESLLGYPPTVSMLAHARSLFAEVLEAPEGVRIQTIHGFCQSLLARFPIEAGISPHFSVMDSRTADEMLAAARLHILVSRHHTAEVETAIRTLAQMLNTEDFQSLLSDIVGNKFRFQSLLRLPGGAEEAVRAVYDYLEVKPETTLQALIDSYFTYDPATENTLRLIADRLLQSADAKLGKALADWLFAEDSRPEMLDSYVLTFLTQKNTKRKKLCNKDSLPSEKLIDLTAEQERVWRFHNARQSLKIATQTGCVIQLAQALLAQYEAIKQTHAKMDYDDLILTARDLLQRPGISPWVLYKLDGGIDHVLVDEAQDTSPEQWEIVKALTEDFFSGLSRSEADRALFIVGDEKQSIFSFQGADVRQLAHVHSWFGARIEDAGKSLKIEALERSYRSLPNILKAVDAVFAAPHVRAGVVTGDATLQHIAHRQGDGLVELWPVIKPISDDDIGDTGKGYVSPSIQLSRLLAEQIQNWISEKKCRAGDIMILVQTRTAFVDQMVRALKRKNVPVAGVDRMILGKNLAVQDLMALGKIMLLPVDDLTLAALLKSPIGNINEEKLFELAWNRGDKSLWQQLEHEPVYALLAELRGKADYLLPYEFYAYALDTLGLRKKILGRMGAEYADPIEEFLSQALAYQQENTPSLQGFLHWLEASDSQIKRDMEQAHDAVRIMTVHGAKGLQAPVVILADTVKMPKQRDKPFWSGDLPIWVKAAEEDNTQSAALREAAKNAALEEYRRLLYVAMTRAEDELYICGATSKNPGEDCWYTLMEQALKPLGSPCETPTGEGARIGSAPTRMLTHASLPLEGEGGRKPGGGDFTFLTSPPPAESNPPKPLAPSHAGEEPPAASPLHKTIYQRGLFIHSLLQHLPSLPEDKRPSIAKTLALPYRTHMSDVEIENGITEALQVIAQFPEVFSGHSLAEVPVAGTITVKGEPFVVSGQIDRLAITDKEVWIVDYKTNRLPPDQPPAAYLRQMAVYHALLREIYPSRAVRCALLWTAGPRMDVLDEAALSTYI